MTNSTSFTTLHREPLGSGGYKTKSVHARQLW